jgi:hypothetical protein
MIIEDVRRVVEKDAVSLQAHVKRHRVDRPPIDFYYRFFDLDEGDVDDTADPFAAACLIKSMRAGEPLDIHRPISRRLHVMLPRIRDIYHNWWPDLFQRIAIHTSPREGSEPAPVATTATFFSGGVDSFYSLLKHHQEGAGQGRPLSHLLFMRGVETPIEKAKDVEASEGWVRDVAAAVGVGTVFGATNVRTHIMSNWEKYDHGSALASIGLCLSPMIGHMCIPSAFSYRHQVPHGSTPLVDEMFSTDRMFVFHDGSEVTRAEKVEAIVRWNRDIGLRYLRVCLGNQGGAYNCGRCRKCVRTAIPLRVMGVLKDAGIFRLATDSHWEAVLEQDHLELLRENLEFAARRQADPALLAMLNRAMKKMRFTLAMQELEKLALTG